MLDTNEMTQKGSPLILTRLQVGITSMNYEWGLEVFLNLPVKGMSAYLKINEGAFPFKAKKIQKHAF